MRTFHSFSLILCALVASCSLSALPSWADGDGGQSAPLQGSVRRTDMLDNSPDTFRLSRTAPKPAQLDKQESDLLRGFTDTQRSPNLAGQASQQGNPDGFRGLVPAMDSPLQSLFGKIGGHAPLVGNVGSDHWTPANLNAPYIWCQSAMGGYYDASGTCKTLVWGDKLRDYGGRFQEGTPVPIEPVTVNSKGHVWYQSDLSKTGFRNRKDFPNNGAGL